MAQIRARVVRLDVGMGDTVILMTTQGSVTPFGVVPRMRRFEVVGIFYAGMYEYGARVYSYDMDWYFSVRHPADYCTAYVDGHSDTVPEEKFKDPDILHLTDAMWRCW